MNKVSVIIPVYNVEHYLEKCIDSIIDQTYRDIELILVDDGSTDKSSNICDDYANKYPNILVTHINNGGQGRARNIGFSMSSSPYIMFCDSDDYYDKDMVEYLLTSIEDSDIKIAMCGLRFIYNNESIEKLIFDKDFITDYNQIINMYFNEDKIISSPVNKIYAREVFDELHYPEDMIFEDRYISLPMFIKYPKIKVLSKAKYNYNIREGSTIQSKFSSKNMDYLKVIDNEKQLLKDSKEFYPSVVNSYIEGIIMLLRKIIIDGYKINKNYYNLLLNKLRDFKKENIYLIKGKNKRIVNQFLYLKYSTIIWYFTRNRIGRLLKR